MLWDWYGWYEESSAALEAAYIVREWCNRLETTTTITMLQFQVCTIHFAPFDPLDSIAQLPQSFSFVRVWDWMLTSSQSSAGATNVYNTTEYWRDTTKLQKVKRPKYSKSFLDSKVWISVWANGNLSLLNLDDIIFLCAFTQALEQGSARNCRRPEIT